MNKAFVRESDDDDDDIRADAASPDATPNYLTPAGYLRLRNELMTLLDDERPRMVETVSWAAKNGDYLYGKKRLREIDRRIRFLSRRLDIARVVDPSEHHGNDQVFFGATVVFSTAQGVEREVTIKGVDEVDSLAGEVSWVSPIARALLQARVGDEVELRTPAGRESIEVLSVAYPAPSLKA